MGGLTPIEPAVKTVLKHHFTAGGGPSDTHRRSGSLGAGCQEAHQLGTGNVLDEAFGQAHFRFDSQIEVRAAASCRATSLSTAGWP